ncbi:hypothetical protein [Pseudonocardia xishanensis]|uniref:Small secreted domain DUF320 n=1 Tax=Pseudonocardia xishanensis TaxID=630995 RepID=A0ABP8S3S6_9PSEU
MSRFTQSTALRIAAASAAGLPLTLGFAGVANAGTGHHDGGPRQTAVQGGSLLGVLGQVNPALNVGGILSKGPVTQTAYSASSANSGVQQHGGHGHRGGRQTAVQGGDVVGVLAQVNPALNVGGILTSGPVTQTAYSANHANSGIEQHDGPGSGGQESFQAGDLVGGLIQVDPAVNVGGIGNSGPVTQTAYTDGSANSGVQQSGGHGHGHDGSQRAVRGGSLLGLNLQVSPAVNIGGILSSGPVTQNATATGSSNSGLLQG